MANYLPNIPQANEDLSDSQPKILGNFQRLDTSFGTDHYPFSDLTTSNGFHNRITTPGFVDNPPVVPVAPPTTTTNPVFYGFEPLDATPAPTTNLGLLQYSKGPTTGPTQTVPTPVTSLHSPETPLTLLASPGPGNSTVILDFTGIPRAFGTVYAMDTTSGAILGDTHYAGFVYWAGSGINAFSLPKITTFGGGLGNTFSLQSTGNVLSLVSAAIIPLNNVYWTLVLHRVS